MDPVSANLLSALIIAGAQNSSELNRALDRNLTAGFAFILQATTQATAAAAGGNLVRAGDGNAFAGLRAANGAEPYHSAPAAKA
jgi:hypothetical protein